MTRGFAKVESTVNDRLILRDRCAGALAGSVISWWDEAAISQARSQDANPQADRQLEGLIVSVKANVDVQGFPTTAASRVLADRAPAETDAPLIGKLRDAGAVFLAQTNMVEFAYGALGPNPFFGTPTSPLFPEERRVTGGSSSGAAVTVATGVVDASVGTDTTGSVRIPAACCGVAAFKPTQGRYSNDGIVPLAQYSLDTAGFLARTIAVCDRMDAAVTGRPLSAHTNPLSGHRFIVPRAFIDRADVDPTILTAFKDALSDLRTAGAVIEDRDMSYLAEIGDVAGKGGLACVEAYLWHADLLQEKFDLYDPRVAPRIAAGAEVPAFAYLAAQLRLRAFAERYAAEMNGFSGLLTPTIPSPPPRLEEICDENRYLACNLRIQFFTEFANEINVPSLCIPISRGTGAASLLVTGTNSEDVSLLQTGRSLEKVLSTYEARYTE